MLLNNFYKADATRFQKASVNFYLLSLLAYTVGSPFNMIEYFSRSFTDFIILDLTGFVIIYAAFFLYQKGRISIRQNSTIYVYTLLINLSVSMWLYDYHGFDVTGNILLNIFMYLINMTVAGFCISRKHSFFTAGMFVVVNGPLLFLTDSLYVRNYAAFIIFLIVIFSFALAEFLKILERSFDEELSLKEKIIEKDRMLAAQQKQILSAELEGKQKEIVAKTMFVLESVEKNNHFIEKLASLKKSIPKTTQKMMDEIIENHRINHHEKYWKEFETSFIEVQQDFFRIMNQKFPTLSSAEMRLAALVHLGLSTKQIADLVSNTPESVDVARSRLRNKLNIPANTNLRTYLSSLLF
jgi:DNA-binding CsgD family transcriptional regulator